MRWLPLLLFASLRLTAATPFMGPEVSSEPYMPFLEGQECPAAAIVRAGSTTFLAWSADSNEGPVIHTTLLDQNLSTIPVTVTRTVRSARPECLSAATSGSEVGLIWREPLAVAGFSTLLGGRLSASSGQFLQGPLTILPAFNTARPGIAYLNPVYGVVAGTFRIDVTSDLRQYSIYPVKEWFSPRLVVKENPVFDSVAAGSTSYAAVVLLHQGPLEITGFEFGAGGGTFKLLQPGFSALGVLHPHPLFLPKAMATNATGLYSQTTISCIGDHCLMTYRYSEPTSRQSTRTAVWTQGEGIKLIDGDARSAVAASAADGERIMIVWDDADRGDVRGVVATLEEITEPFVIAAGDGQRRRPSVAAVGDGRFLVAYEIVRDGVTRLGGRVVDVNAPPRRRRATTK